MRRLFFLFSILFMLSVGSAASFAQSASAVAEADRPTKEELNRLFDVMKVRVQMDSMLQVMPQTIQQQLQSQQDSFEASAPGGKLTPEQKAAVGKVTAKYAEKAMHMYPEDEMIADIMTVYEHHLTKADVKGIIAFYQTPAGQHLLEQQPKMMQEIMPLIMQKAQDRSKVLFEEYVKEAGEAVQGAK